MRQTVRIWNKLDEGIQGNEHQEELARGTVTDLLGQSELLFPMDEFCSVIVIVIAHKEKGCHCTYRKGGRV